MDFLPADIQHYVETTTTPENDLLKEINRDTHLHVLNPRMLSGHFQGRVLAMFSRMIRPKNILEIGTYTGYATLCLAEGLDSNGKITTIDINNELSERVKNNFQKSAYVEQIIYIKGDAKQIIPDLEETWDLVFIDADKENYVSYYDMIVDKVSSGGFIIADNVLWSGKVVERDQSDKKTRELKTFNNRVHTDNRVENVLLPIRDGLMLLRKK
jgi:predicted O-methyltransferase YrrM